jgi:hypothetical protein
VAGGVELTAELLVLLAQSRVAFARKLEQQCLARRAHVLHFGVAAERSCVFALLFLLLSVVGWLPPAGRAQFTLQGPAEGARESSVCGESLRESVTRDPQSGRETDTSHVTRHVPNITCVGRDSRDGDVGRARVRAETRERDCDLNTLLSSTQVCCVA